MTTTRTTIESMKKQLISKIDSAIWALRQPDFEVEASVGIEGTFPQTLSWSVDQKNTANGPYFDLFVITHTTYPGNMTKWRESNVDPAIIAKLLPALHQQILKNKKQLIESLTEATAIAEAFRKDIENSLCVQAEPEVRESGS